MKLSVAMPVFNGEKSLRRTLDCVLNSSLAEFELIISDDCSTDRSMEIIRGFKDPRIKILQNDTNLGYPKNMQRAFDACQGDVVVLCAQDDIISNSILENYLHIFSADKNLGALTRAYYAYSTEIGKPIRIKNIHSEEPDGSLSIFARFGDLKVLRAILNTLDQLSLLALRKKAVTKRFSDDVFPCHVYPFLSVLDGGCHVALMNSYPLAVWVDTSQCIRTSWIYDKSPVETWSNCLDDTLSQALRKEDLVSIKRDFVFGNWIGLFQIRNYSKQPFKYVLREICLMARNNPRLIFKLEFIATLFLVTMVPRVFLIRFVNFVKKQVNPLFVREVPVLNYDGISKQKR